MTYLARRAGLYGWLVVTAVTLAAYIDKSEKLKSTKAAYQDSMVLMHSQQAVVMSAVDVVDSLLKRCQDSVRKLGTVVASQKQEIRDLTKDLQRLNDVGLVKDSLVEAYAEGVVVYREALLTTAELAATAIAGNAKSDSFYIRRDSILDAYYQASNVALADALRAQKKDNKNDNLKFTILGAVIGVVLRSIAAGIAKDS